MNISDTKESISKDNDNLIRKSLSHMVGMHRNVLVMYYYDNIKIKDIAVKLGVSEEMVKYYLMSGRKKMREVYKSMENVSEKSFKPKSLSIRMWSLDFNNIDIWKIMSRILPQQIALICKDKAYSIEDIGKALNVASCFIEEEVNILVLCGLLIEISKGRFQTNFVILDEKSIININELFKKYHQGYIEKVNEKFQEILPKLRKTSMFKHNVSDDRYYAMFIYMVTKCDWEKVLLSNEDYPIILTNGVRAFIYAYTAQERIQISRDKLLYGQTPTGISKQIVENEKVVLWAIDFAYDTGHQKNLMNEAKATAIYEVYNDMINEKDKELYAKLISENYLIKQNNKLYSNVAVINEEIKIIMDKVNMELLNYLYDSNILMDQISNIVRKNMPDSLKNYSKGYALTLYTTEADNRFYSSIMSGNDYFNINDLKLEPHIPFFCNLKID